ncbi:MAG TPA: hypothetical protein VN253_13395, partial [Kofleriaceae bacterium]|nr:hypothetical protein [Kofleriaceae bacterium]
MKLAPLLALALSLAGCTLYFGPADPPATAPPEPGGPPGDPVDPGGPIKPGGPLPATCGTPEVHVLSVYETSSNHSGGNHPTGTATVTIERPGDLALVLSAYEPTDWHVTLAPGAHVRSVTLIGYLTQTVNLANVPIVHAQGCGYSYPYNGGGCDTNQLLALAKQHAGADVTTFHGCYQASSWTLHADGSAASNCNTAAGYEVDELVADCPGGSSTWEQASFPTYSPAACTGARYVR